LRDKNENKQSALKDWLRKNELFVEVEEEEISEEEALALKEEEEKRIEEKEQKKEERIAAAAEKREKDRESFRIFLGKANDFLYRVRESLQFAAEQVGTAFRNTSEKIRNAVSEKKFDPFYVVVPLISLLIIGASWLFASGIFEDPGYDIILNDSGRVTQITTTERTVGEFIRANGFGYTAADRLDAEFSDTLYDGMTITIYRSVDVTINKAGEIYETKMLAGTVADAIEESGITLGENDEVYPALETYITEATTIDIIEVEYVFEKELTTLHYTETEKNDPTLAKGKTVVKQKGEDGYKESTIRITLKNGREVARETVEEIVLKEPVTEITLIGTYVKPTPTPSRHRSKRSRQKQRRPVQQRQRHLPTVLPMSTGRRTAKASSSKCQQFRRSIARQRFISTKMYRRRMKASSQRRSFSTTAQPIRIRATRPQREHGRESVPLPQIRSVSPMEQRYTSPVMAMDESKIQAVCAIVSTFSGISLWIRKKNAATGAENTM